jgi:hypothetical protein
MMNGSQTRERGRGVMGLQAQAYMSTGTSSLLHSSLERRSSLNDEATHAESTSALKRKRMHN